MKTQVISHHPPSSKSQAQTNYHDLNSISLWPNILVHLNPLPQHSTHWMLFIAPHSINLVIKSSSHSITRPLSSLLNHKPISPAPSITPLSSVELDFYSLIKFGAPSKRTFTPFSRDMELEVLHREKLFTMEPLTIKRYFFENDNTPPCPAKRKVSQPRENPRDIKGSPPIPLLPPTL